MTRDENKQSHFCVYFLPYDPEKKSIFIVHHKKSNLWLSPGGHIDRGEDLLSALNREIQEELGVNKAFLELPRPFLISITPINNTPQPCREHLDLWFLFRTNGKNFQVDLQEFYDTKWVTLEQAAILIKDAANLKALSAVKQYNQISDSMMYTHIKIGVGVLIYKNGKILFGKRLKGAGSGSWGLPGGHLEVGETLGGCARREIAEETGLELHDLEFRSVVNDPRPDGHYMHFVFEAKSWSGEPQVLEPDKCEAWEWFSLDNLPENPFYGHKKILESIKKNISIAD